jgi:SAM-dependent methyltransferase
VSWLEPGRYGPGGGGRALRRAVVRLAGLRTARERRLPLVGLARLGSLRRLTPISDQYGFDRGLPGDRYYIEDFLRRFAAAPGYSAGDLSGRILEVGDAYYATKFGPPEARVDVLHANAANDQATLVGDLVTGAGVPESAFDCIICTQTLHVIFDVPAAIATIHRALKPNGVALVTVPGIAPASRPDRDRWGDWWRFTGASARRLFEQAFDPANVTVEAYGNVLTAVGFLHGLAAEELTPTELDARDPNYEVIIGVRAVKAAA